MPISAALIFVRPPGRGAIAGSGSKIEPAKIAVKTCCSVPSPPSTARMVTPWRARRASASGQVCTRLRRHLHDLGRVLKSLLECGRGSAAQTGPAITEKAQSHGSPGMQTGPSCPRAAPSRQASFLTHTACAGTRAPTPWSSCLCPHLLPGPNRPAAPALDTSLTQAQRVKPQRTDGPDRNEPETQLGTPDQDPERQ